ncbi:regulator of g protein signaling domain containing protein [Acanthamoeba castellanii str. Neff]|uniref:Regulator of g protein signaling domain containing protein n=1 Tax=Acanthamoeba castellanii (strain ATCC 30010 / Neff) TaxID=1257118 RepID=L8HLT6_ACACF|nr:regulator of g protein signaling domain containing protein [Acanthamoeba castellanii str. Neff]ELR25386.1 regulator of g protein signaling domain containing protein [Acanthamoeba castellanii str. Neff]
MVRCPHLARPTCGLLRSPDFLGCGEQKKSKDSGEKKKEEKLPRPSLLEVLENRELALSFRQFLHKWYSNENLAFWVAVEDYKGLPREERKKRADEIYGKYFRPNSDYEINITNDQKRQLDASLAGANPDVFNKIQHSIFNLLETDCFPRFLDSDLYKEYEQGVLNQKGRKRKDSKKVKKKLEAPNPANREVRSESLIMLERYAQSHERS